MSPGSVTVHPMSAVHLDAVVDIERDASPTPWTPGMFEDVLRSPDGTAVVAVDGAGPVQGFALSLVQAGEVHVMNVAVRPDRRRGGLASLLMLALVDDAVTRAADAITLEVRASNLGAQRLYHRFGFAPVGVRPRYYQGEDAVIMWTPPLRDDAMRERIEAVRAQIISRGAAA